MAAAQGSIGATSLGREEMWPRSYQLGSTIDKWGPSGWNTLHAFAHARPAVMTTEEQVQFVELLRAFANHLPCPQCKKHFLEYLRAHVEGDSFETREKTVRFLHDAHNDVSRRLGKRVVSFRAHMRIYGPREVQDWTACHVAAIAAVVAAVLGARAWRRRRSRA